MTNADAKPATAMRVCPACDVELAADQPACKRCGTQALSLRSDVDPNLGRVLDGRYEIRGLLGAGGMGSVYRAWQRSVGREVVIKLIHPGYCRDLAWMRRFLREARLASQLHHPHTVAILDFGQGEQGDLFLAMELLMGRSLQQVSLADGAFDAARTVRVGVQLCDALAAAHARRIVHRDLKPANVMILDEPAGRDFVKVLDFGLAKDLAGSESESTQSGHVLGTPRYMAPELFYGQAPTPASDLYSVGILLGELHLGRSLFASDAMGVLQAEKVALSLPPAVDPRLRRVLSRLLEPNASQRLCDAQAARERLEACLSEPPAADAGHTPTRTLTLGSPIAAPASPPRSRRRAWPLALVALLAALGAGAWALRGRSSPPPSSPAVAPPGPPLEDAQTLPAIQAWSTTSIPVCWETPGREAEKRVVRKAVKRTLELASGVVFEGWGGCASPDARGIHIRVADEWPSTRGLGRELDGRAGGVTLNFDYVAIARTAGSPLAPCTGDAREDCIAVHAVHELGHALGFEHRGARLDSAALCGGGAGEGRGSAARDPLLAVAYCAPTSSRSNLLAPLVVETLERHYGYPAGQDMEFLLADVDGQHKQSVLQLWRGWPSIPTCRLAGGNLFSCRNDKALLADSGSPAQRILAGDFDADGRADLVYTYRKWDRLPRCLARPNGWSCSEPTAPLLDNSEDTNEAQFLVGRFNRDQRSDLVQVYRRWKKLPTCLATEKGWSCADAPAEVVDSGSPEQQFLVGDVNGDGLSDVIQAYRGWTNLPYCLADGAGGWSCKDAMAQVYDWNSAEQRFHTGDFNGDGKTDVIQTFRRWRSFPLCLSTGEGWSCSNPEAEIEDSGSPEQQFVVGDYNGDGKSDVVIAYRPWKFMTACLSTGTGFACHALSATSFDSGSPEQRFLAGDVDGDGADEIVLALRSWGSYPVCKYSPGGWMCSNYGATLFNPGY